MEQIGNFEIRMRLMNLESTLSALAKGMHVAAELHDGLVALRTRLQDVPEVTDECFALIKLLAPTPEGASPSAQKPSA